MACCERCLQPWPTKCSECPNEIPAARIRRRSLTCSPECQRNKRLRYLREKVRVPRAIKSVNLAGNTVTGSAEGTDQVGVDG